ncbi:MAG: hypothetical protein K5739_12600 [Lachnospiraceae bacterium]|nr:hypothetical protein [Lachnospiraceae bacterium]
MKTMTNRMFWRNYNYLPMEAKIRYAISLIMAITGLSMIVLDAFGVAKFNINIELLLCNLGLWNNILMMKKYQEYLVEK